MIIDVWAWEIADGKLAEAMEWLNQVNQIHVSNGKKNRTLRPANGTINKVFAQIEFNSFSDFDEYWGNFWQSDAWQKIANGWQGLLVQNTAERYQLNVVE